MRPNDGEESSKPIKDPRGGRARTERRIGRFRLDDLVVGDADNGLWRAWDERLARKVSLRIIPQTDPVCAAVREAASQAARVDSRRIAKVLDVIDIDDALVVVAEWIDGISLEQALHSPVSVASAIAITREVLDALQDIAAAGAHHGRLRPATVMLTSEREIRLRGHCIDAALFGVSPGEDSASADVYGVGAVLTALLTATWPAGQPQTTLRDTPVVGHHLARPSQLRADLSAELDTFVIRSLAAGGLPQTVPTRFAFTDLFAQRNALTTTSDAVGAGPLGNPIQKAVGEVLGARPVQPAPIYVPEPRPKNRARTLALVAAATSSVLALGVGVALWLDDPSDQTAANIAYATSGTDSESSAQPAARPNTAPIEEVLPIKQVYAYSAATGSYTPSKSAKLSVDDDLASVWTTDPQDHSDVDEGSRQGIVVDLGWERDIRVVDLGLLGNNSNIEIRASNKLSKRASDLTLVQSLKGAPNRLSVRQARPVSARYVMVLFTKLPTHGNAYEGGISNLAVRGS